MFSILTPSTSSPSNQEVKILTGLTAKCQQLSVAKLSLADDPSIGVARIYPMVQETLTADFPHVQSQQILILIFINCIKH